MADTPNAGPVSLLLTDLYQITMVYAYWKAGRHECSACFELFFRKNPFKGGFTVFGGLKQFTDQILRRSPCFTAEDIAFVKSRLSANVPDEFFEYLGNLDLSKVTIDSAREGSVVFPRVPIMSVRGPLAVCQLIESTLLNLTGYASLLATNAARMRLCVGPDTELLEFGLRRAQGSDGAMSAARYAYLGGFNSTSNVAAGKRFSIPIKGTHAHSFVASFHTVDDLKAVDTVVEGPSGKADVLALARKYGAVLATHFYGRTGPSAVHEGELLAFVTYATAFPPAFLALVDTYNTLHSGVVNFLAVSAALHSVGHRGIGIRLDSGDLAKLSLETRKMFEAAPKVLAAAGLDSEDALAYFAKFAIVVSDGINTTKLLRFARDGHSIDTYGIGTNLVTCQEQPSLGMVYKLVAIDGVHCMKLSADPGKILLPGRKQAYRFFNEDGTAAMDVLESVDAGGTVRAPQAGVAWKGNWPLGKRAEEIGEAGIEFTPSKVQPLLEPLWGPEGNDAALAVDVHAAKAHSEHQRSLLPAAVRSVENPGAYPTFTSWPLYESTMAYIRKATAKSEAAAQ